VKRTTVWRPYCQMKTSPPPTEVVATEGCELLTRSGRRLIDGLASWWSACHGYNHPHIVSAIRQQADRMPHVMFGGITHAGAERLAERLTRRLPGDLDHLFFADSGSVAVEVAMKMAIGHWHRRGLPEKSRFVAFHHAYHGDTTGAMSLCDPVRGMHTTYGDALLPQWHVPLPTDAESAELFATTLRQNHHRLAGVFLEPLVQGAGGMRFHSPETVRRIRETCDQLNVLLIADEIATGFGRTGSMWAIDQVPSTVPDILCLGKALTGGAMTMAVTIARHDVFDSFWSDESADAFMHGPTFMANPLACAAANASLDLFDSEPRLQQAAAIQQRLRHWLEGCRELPGVTDVRCRGAIGVIQVDELTEVDWLRQAFVEAGVWLRPFGDCIYATPPLTLAESQIDQLGSAMKDVTTRWSRRTRPHRQSFAIGADSESLGRPAT